MDKEFVKELTNIAIKPYGFIAIHPFVYRYST